MIRHIAEPVGVLRAFVLHKWEAFSDRYKPLLPMSADLETLIESIPGITQLCSHDFASVDHFVFELAKSRDNFVRSSLPRLERNTALDRFRSELDLTMCFFGKTSTGHAPVGCERNLYEWRPIANLAIDNANRRQNSTVDTLDFLQGYFSLLNSVGHAQKAARLASLISGSMDTLAKNISALTNLKDSEGKWAITWMDGRFRAVPLVSIGSISTNQTESRPFDVCLANNIRLILSKHIAEFEEMLNSRDADERDFQRFFESHPQFLLLDDYVEAHSHLTLAHQRDERSEKLSRRLQIPDFFLESVRGFADIAELKKPTLGIRTHGARTERASAEITKAVRQLFRYREFFQESDNRKWFREQYELNVYKPNLVLVIGRASQFESAEERKQLLVLPREVSVYTYDDLLQLAKERCFVVEA